MLRAGLRLDRADGYQSGVREYPTAIVENVDNLLECRLSNAELACGNIRTGRTNTYASLTACLEEPAVPNRVYKSRIVRRSFGTFAFQGGSSSTHFSYDSQGRLLRRARCSGSDCSSLNKVNDVLDYTAWDPFGRPTRGIYAPAREVESIEVSVAYDDERRTLSASNGEMVEQDRRGNVVREVSVFGVARPAQQVVTYETTTTASACPDAEVMGPLSLPMPPAPPTGPSLAGEYLLAVEASPRCRDRLPRAAQVRSYDATVTQRWEWFEILIHNVRAFGSGGFGGGKVAGSTLTLHLAFYDGNYEVSLTGQGDVRPGQFSVLAAGVVNFAEAGRATVECEASDHRLLLQSK